MIGFIVISKNMISCIEIRDKLDAAGVYKVQTSSWWGGVVAWYGMSTSGNLKKWTFLDLWMCRWLCNWANNLSSFNVIMSRARTIIHAVAVRLLIGMYLRSRWYKQDALSRSYYPIFPLWMPNVALFIYEAHVALVESNIMVYKMCVLRTISKDSLCNERFGWWIYYL